MKKTILLVMLLASVANAYAVSLSSADLTPIKCTMMSDGDMAIDMDCDCPMDQLPCDHCVSMLDLSSPVALPIDDLIPPLLHSSSNYSNRYLLLASINLRRSSPPPIIH